MAFDKTPFLVTGTNNPEDQVSVDYQNALLTALETAINALEAAPFNTVLPAITGFLGDGETLIVSNGTWVGAAAYTYQWRRDGVNISGATSATYEQAALDVGAAIDAVVTAYNGGGNTSATAPAAVYDPGVLFQGAEVGDVWINDPAYYFTDTAATTPVTTIGDQVAAWEGSVNGVLATQGTDANRPTYQEDSEGNAYLDFGDETDQLFLRTTSLALGATAELSVVSGLKILQSGGTNGWAVNTNSLDDPSMGLYVGQGVGSNPSGAQILGNLGGGVGGSAGLSAAPGPSTDIYSMVIDGAAPSFRLGRNIGDSTTSTASIGASTFGSRTFDFGQRTNDTAPFGGRIYTMAIINGELAADAREGLETYFSTRQPFSLAYVLGDSTIYGYNSSANVLNLMDREEEAFSLAANAHTIANQKAEWIAAAPENKSKSKRWVAIQVGLNDMDPAEAASVAIARLQDLVDTVRADVGDDCQILVGQMVPAKSRWISLYGGTDGLVAQAKWEAMNEAIAGSGPTPLTDVDIRVTGHVALLDDASGNLDAAYDTANPDGTGGAGDGIHPNTAGTQIIADAWQDALTDAGLTI